MLWDQMPSHQLVSHILGQLAEVRLAEVNVCVSLRLQHNAFAQLSKQACPLINSVLVLGWEGRISG